MATIRPIADVMSDIENAILAAGGSLNGCYYTVKEVKSTGYHRTPTGAYSIDIWGLKKFYGQRATRDHLFRTKSDGTVPVQKIMTFVRERLAELKQAHERQEAAKKVAGNNGALAQKLRDKANETDGYYSEYVSQSSKFIAPSETADNKVSINIGPRHLTGEQADALLDLLASFKK